MTCSSVVLLAAGYPRPLLKDVEKRSAWSRCGDFSVSARLTQKTGAPARIATSINGSVSHMEGLTASEVSFRVVTLSGQHVPLKGAKEAGPLLFVSMSNSASATFHFTVGEEVTHAVAVLFTIRGQAVESPLRIWCCSVCDDFPYSTDRGSALFRICVSSSSVICRRHCKPPVASDIAHEIRREPPAPRQAGRAYAVKSAVGFAPTRFASDCASYGARTFTSLSK